MRNDFKNYRNEAFANKKKFIEYFDYFAHIHYGKDILHGREDGHFLQIREKAEL